jgi:hypothetical protein
MVKPSQSAASLTQALYRNTIAGSPPGKQITYFEKIMFASQKLNFSIFVFFKNQLNDLK